MSINKKLVAIVGPTASGKTALAIELAKKCNGEVISADSRQVYKGLDIGSGKVTRKEMQGIPHYLLDVANPKRKFSVAQYQKLALGAIKKIHAKNKIPILVGGTGLYIQSVVDGIVIPEVKPDWKLRKILEKKSVEQLFSILKKKDLTRAKTIDRYNKRRLVRALEIIAETKKPIGPLKTKQQFKFIEVGILKSKEELAKHIKKRLQQRLKNNALVNEVKNLRKSLSWKRLEELGLEYRFVAQYLQGKLTYQHMQEKLGRKIRQFAKRQMTWFKRDKRIHWVKNKKEAHLLVKKFLQ